MLAPVQTSPALEPAVSLEEAKLYCRAFHDDDDELIAGFVSAATIRLERILGMKFVTQAWRQDLGGFTGDLRLPFRPIDPGSVLIDYYDQDGMVQSVDYETFVVLTDVRGSFVRSKVGWPATESREDAVSVYFDAGVEPSEIHDTLKLAIKALVAHWYEHREASAEKAVQPLPFGVDMLISSYREMLV